MDHSFLHIFFFNDHPTTDIYTLSLHDALPIHGAKSATRIRSVHPFVRNVVIGVVGLLIAAGLTALSVLSADTAFSVAAMLVSALIAVAIGIFLFIQGWIWSQRAYRSRSTGMS